MLRRVRLLLAVLLSCLAVVSLLGAFALRASAAGNADPLAPNQGNPVWTPFNISDDLTHTQQYAAAAANAANRSYFVVWKDDTTPASLSGRLVSAAGEVLTRTQIGVSSVNNNLTPWVDVAFNSVSANQFLVVWNASSSQEGGDIYGQRVAANGVPISGTFRIDDADNHADHFPTIVQDTTHGQFLAVWSERWDEHPGAFAQISGRLLNQIGEPLTGTVKIGDLNDYDLGRPAAAYNSVDDQFLVVWDEWYNGGLLHARRLLHNGVPLSATLTITTVAATSSDQIFPDIAYDRHYNRYLVVWADGGGNDFNIYGQLLAADGQPIGGSIAIANSAIDQRHPAVSYYDGEQGGVFLVTWDEQHPSPHNKDIYGRWITGNGALLGNAMPFVTDTGNHLQGQPALAFNSLTRLFLVAWQGESTHDIFGMRTTGLPYDLSLDADHFWSRPFVIHSGDSVTLTAPVFNRFGQALTDVAVEFYNGDPDSGGQMIGATTVDFAAGSQSAQASVAWDITGLTGTQELFVTVDPQNLVPEIDETNNTATRARTIWPAFSDTQAPTGTLTIDAGAAVTGSSEVTLTIAAFDDNPLGVPWMYLRQWWITSNTGLGDSVSVGGQRGRWWNSDSGWVRYRPEYASSGFPFALNGNPGIHYVQVWLRDAAGNISQSPPPIWDSINYAPPFPWTLMPDEWHLYRMGWTLGASVAISMSVTGDDDALVVWSPGNSGPPDLVSDLPGPNAHTESLTFNAAAGVYQILAYGQPPYGGQYQIGWQPSNRALAAASLAAPAGDLPSAPVIPAGETPPTSSGLPEFQTAATGVFTTGWTAIAPGQTITFTHNLGGDLDQYAVELWFLDDAANGAGMHRRGYGGNRVGGQMRGAYWSNLTGNTIRVTRNADDATADQVRLRIWQADPPDWDSGWIAIQPGDANRQTLIHNLGGNADDYLVALKFRDSSPGGLGVHHYAYGGLDLGGQVQGAAWFNLTNTSVQVVRFAGDAAAPEVRVMVYRPDPAQPPAYDSGWRTLNLGQLLALTHNLGGNPVNYMVRVSTHSTAHGINSFGAGGLTLDNGQGRGGFVQRLTGNSIEVYRLPQDIYNQQTRVRIWLPMRSIYLPLVDNASGSAQELSYDDGTRESDQSNNQNSGFAVRFTVDGAAARVQSGRFYLNGATGTHPIEMHVWDSDHADLIAPFQATPPAGIGWFDVDLSLYNLTRSGDFYLGFLYPEASFDPSLGVDADAPHDGRSYEVPWQQVANDYMIRAVIQR